MSQPCLITFTPIFFELPVDHSKVRLVVFASPETIPEFCVLAVANPYNYVAVRLVLRETQGSIRGINGWEYSWLPLSPR